MKKIIVMSVICVLLVLSFTVIVFAESSIGVTASIFDENGEIALGMGYVEVNDVDDDGIISINDALICAHDKYYEGGADEGFNSEESQYGITLTKLWGYNNGVAYGYYHNNGMAMSLLDEVTNGDYISAFVYRDVDFFSDTYTFFGDVQHLEDSVQLTLNCIGFDENWNTVNLPLENAEITVNGNGSGIFTDSEGKCTLDIDKAGKYIISAKCDGMIIVAPIYIFEKEATFSDTEIVFSETAEEENTPDTLYTEDTVSETEYTNAVPASPSTGDSVLYVAVFALISSCTAVIIKKND